MQFVMFAFNALHAFPSLLWHLTAVGRGVGRVVQHWRVSSLWARTEEITREHWGCDRKMQMIHAGQWCHRVTWRFVKWRKEEHSARLPPQNLPAEGDFSAFLPWLWNLSGVARRVLRTVLFFQDLKSNMCGLRPSIGK